MPLPSRATSDHRIEHSEPKRSTLPSEGTSFFDDDRSVWLEHDKRPIGRHRWSHTAVGVFAVPHWKVFVFGGNSGNLSEGTNPQVRTCIVLNR